MKFPHQIASFGRKTVFLFNIEIAMPMFYSLVANECEFE